MSNAEGVLYSPQGRVTGTLVADRQAPRHALVDGASPPRCGGAEVESVPTWLYAATVPTDAKDVTNQFSRFTAAIARTTTSVIVSIRTDAP